MPKPNGQRVLIVGGARDIGFAVAQAVTEAGATAIIGARDHSRAHHAADNVSNAEAVYIDITDENSIVEALNNCGSLDHIVVTTSAHHNAAITNLEYKKAQAAFDAKIIGPLILAKHAAQILPDNGSIVLFSGIAAWNPDPGYAIMAITNGAVSFAASHLAKELAPIRVNALSPGVIDSGSWDGLGSEAKKDFLSGAAASTLVQRHGENSDITDAVLWLLTAGFVSGETLHVQGGARFN